MVVGEGGGSVPGVAAVPGVCAAVAMVEKEQCSEQLLWCFEVAVCMYRMRLSSSVVGYNRLVLVQKLKIVAKSNRLAHVTVVGEKTDMGCRARATASMTFCALSRDALGGRGYDALGHEATTD